MFEFDHYTDPDFFEWVQWSGPSDSADRQHWGLCYYGGDLWGIYFSDFIAEDEGTITGLRGEWVKHDKYCIPTSWEMI